MIGTHASRVSASELQSRAEALRAIGGRFQFAYAWFPEGEKPEVRYLSSIPGQQDSLEEVPAPLVVYCGRSMPDCSAIM